MAIPLERHRDRTSGAGRLSLRSRLLRGGADGNARLTALTALVLLLLLAAEGATIPFIGSLLTPHIFLGVLLIPPVLVKLASTGWRLLRYYGRGREYVAKGPPQAFHRLLIAPLVVASTVALFGTGVLLMVLGPRRGLVVGLHKASFIVWVAAMTVHVLAHLLEVPRLTRDDVTRPLAGAGLRRFLVAGAVVVGLIAAVVTLPVAHEWASWAVSHHHDHRDG